MTRPVPEPGSPAGDAASIIGPAAIAAPFSDACWCDVVTRADALPGLDPKVLLHAGPPFEGAVPVPVLQAAAQALMHEGVAQGMPQAIELIERGEVVLRPAQDHGVVTPLAHVVSASMPLAVVANGGRVTYAPLVEGPAPALRFGSPDPACLDRLALITALGLHRLAPILRRRPVAIARVIEHALAAGDECHGRTAAANERLLAVLDGLSAGDAALIAANPNFVLPVLMAAAGGLLGRQPSGVAAVGGNGEAFGFRLHGAAAWTVVPAQPPVGGRLPGREHAAALGAIGDSAVLDFCGLGGQAMHLAPSLSSEWASLLVDDPVARRSAVIDPQSGLVDVARVVAGGPVPQVNLAILDRTGRSGLLGRGFYLPPSALFDRTGWPFRSGPRSLRTRLRS